LLLLFRLFQSLLLPPLLFPLLLAAGDGAGTGADSLNSSFLNMYNLLKILNVNKTCASTRISRFYIDYIDYINNDGAPEYVRKLRKIWEKKDIVIIEGEESRLGIGNNLFK